MIKEEKETPEKQETKKTTAKSKPKKIAQAEYEKKVIELAEKGLTSERIGQELRNQEIHPKEYNKKISQILKEKNLYQNPDLKNVETKLERIKNHYEKNKQDKRAMREKDRVFSQVRRTKKYLKLPLK